MDQNLAPYIDHTLLKADASKDDIVRLCHEARVHGFKSVCVNPVYVKFAKSLLLNEKNLVVSVVGFPLGLHLAEVKIRETELACLDGADEIDMVIRLDLVKSHEWQMVEQDISRVVRTAGNKPVKVILETCLLTSNEISEACRVSEAAGATFVKSSTGMLGRGATLEDIQLMKKSCGLLIKASGGIKSTEFAWQLIQAGATRLGTSSGVQLLTFKETLAEY